ncbi:MAG TPA: hypothetical protein VND45_15540 [Thermoanaerobaculia bacterium]|nr:hypothetical protein [Thermoanaerobaculia bacterium]
MTATLSLALAATIVVETLIASLILRRFVLLRSLAVQLVTWPIAQWLVSTGRPLALVELGVFVAEVILWRLVLPLTWRRALIVSLATNGATAAIAFAIR